MKVEYKERNYNDHFEQLAGDDKFSKAVNKNLSDYWVKTGEEKGVMTAIIETLADFYNSNVKDI